jgi:hypothetical protein
MPASEIMSDFRAGHLHSGPGGPIVKKKKQAKAIQLSYLRKEGRAPLQRQNSSLPEKRSLRHSYAREKHQ